MFWVVRNIRLVVVPHFMRYHIITNTPPTPNVGRLLNHSTCYIIASGLPSPSSEHRYQQCNIVCEENVQFDTMYLLCYYIQCYST